MEDKFYTETYIKYRERIKEASFSKPVSYDWFALPTQNGAEWFIYCETLKDLSRQLANDINHLWRDITKLEAWSEIISHYDEKEKLYLLVEFIETLAIVALNLPYAIRSRFIFSLSHICHQANRIKNSDWKDDLSNDRSINFKTMDSKCVGWKTYNNFKLRFSQIADDKFEENTSEFRHRFHHRIPVSVELGLTGLISRQKNQNGQVGYSIGGTRPLSLKKLVPILKDQYTKIVKCFEEYQILVTDQLNEIFGT